MDFHTVAQKVREKKYEYNLSDDEKAILDKGKYREGFVFDENLTVKQNREMVEAKNSSFLATQTEVRRKRSDANNEFYSDLRSAIRDDLGGMSIKDIEPIMSKITEKDTFGEMLEFAEEITTIIRNIF